MKKTEESDTTESDDSGAASGSVQKTTTERASFLSRFSFLVPTVALTGFRGLGRSFLVLGMCDHQRSRRRLQSSTRLSILASAHGAPACFRRQSTRMFR
jgi:hypothetical protein